MGRPKSFENRLEINYATVIQQLLTQPRLMILNFIPAFNTDKCASKPLKWVNLNGHFKTILRLLSPRIEWFDKSV